MADGDVVDHLGEALAGLTPDVLDPILDVVADIAFELGDLTHDEVVQLVRAAITAAAGAAAGAAMKHRLESRGGDLDAAIRRALATP